MSNLTITIDDDLLRSARIRAIQQGTSVNEVCRQAIAAFAREADADEVARRHAKAQAFYDHAKSLKLGGSRGRLPTRDELYEEMLSERSPGGRRDPPEAE